MDLMCIKLITLMDGGVKPIRGLMYCLLPFFSTAAKGCRRCWGSPGLLALLPLLIFYYPRPYAAFRFFLWQRRLAPSPSPPASSLKPARSPPSSAPHSPHSRQLHTPFSPASVHGRGNNNGRPPGSTEHRYRWSISRPRHPSTENPERICPSSCYVATRSS